MADRKKPTKQNQEIEYTRPVDLPIGLNAMSTEQTHISGGQLKRSDYRPGFDSQQMMSEVNPNYKEQQQKLAAQKELGDEDSG